MHSIDLSGQVFGRLTVIRHATKDRYGHVSWHCKCECGGTTDLPTGALRSGNTRSCGCFKLETISAMGAASAIHGHSRAHGTPTYRSWQAMKSRCLNQKYKTYQRYGARGISVCQRWLTFENFLADMGERPAGATLDRYPNGLGNYEPGNCRWATRSEQNRNRRPWRRCEEMAA